MKSVQAAAKKGLRVLLAVPTGQLASRMRALFADCSTAVVDTRHALGYASNVHKVQGDEFDHVTIWLNIENMPAAGYAALSRVKHAKNYLIGGKVTRRHFVPAS